MRVIIVLCLIFKIRLSFNTKIFLLSFLIQIKLSHIVCILLISIILYFCH